MKKKQSFKRKSDFMRKVLKEYNVYKFEELSKDIQDELLEKYIEDEYIVYCEHFLEEDMKDLAQNILNEQFKGAKYDNVYYDLSYSQGSGSMISFTIDLLDLNNMYKKLTKKEIKELESFGGTEIKVYHDNSRYYHEYTFEIDYNDFTDYYYEWKHIKDIGKTQEKIESMINDLFKKDIIEMNKELTKNGHSLLEDRDNFKENAMNRLQEDEYLENGKTFYE